METVEPKVWPEHCLGLGKFLYQQVEEGSSFCDFPIKTAASDEVIYVHSSVMCMIPFVQWRREFQSEKSADALDLSNLPSVGLDMVIKFLYTGELLLDLSTVGEILEVAVYLDMHEILVSKILDWLFSRVPTLNNIVTLRFVCDAFELNHPGIESMRLFFDGKLSELLDGEYLYSVDNHTLAEIIQNEAYNYIPRIKFVKFLLRWTHHDLEQREQFFPDIFKLIQLKQIETKDLQTLHEDPFIKNFPDSVAALRKARRMSKKRKVMPVVDAIIVAGGKAPTSEPLRLVDYHNLQTSNVWAYLLKRDKWIALTNLPEKMDRPSMACDSNGMLCVVEQGMYCSTSISLSRFSLQEATWTTEELFFQVGFQIRYVKELFSILDKLYILVYGVRSADERNELHPMKAFIFEVRTQLVDPIMLQKAYQETRVRVCTLESQVLISLSDKHEPSAFLVNPALGSQIRVSKRIAKTLGFGYMCNFGKNFVQYCPGRSMTYYVVRNRKLVVCEENAMPPIPADKSPFCMATTSFGGDLMVFGGQSLCGQGFQAAFCFDYAEQKWDRLADMPESLVDSAALPIKLPWKYTTCPADCPHCLLPTQLSDVVFIGKSPPVEEFWD